MLKIDVTTNLEQATKNISYLVRKQVPYAASLAINALAKEVLDGEKEAMSSVFKDPTPFTVGSVRRTFANKTKLEAKVFVMDTAAEYLAPYEYGGYNKLIGVGKTWLSPKDKDLLNQYGNFPAAFLERYAGTTNFASSTRLKRGVKPLPGKPGYFIGTVKNSKGHVGGLWKRVEKGGKKGRGLKLLMRFADAHTTTNHPLRFHRRAELIVAFNFNDRFNEALGKALATPKP